MIKSIDTDYDPDSDAEDSLRSQFLYELAVVNYGLFLEPQSAEHRAMRMGIDRNQQAALSVPVFPFAEVFGTIVALEAFDWQECAANDLAISVTAPTTNGHAFAEPKPVS
jgi:hypothetical protein